MTTGITNCVVACAAVGADPAEPWLPRTVAVGGWHTCLAVHGGSVGQSLTTRKKTERHRRSVDITCNYLLPAPGLRLSTYAARTCTFSSPRNSFQAGIWLLRPFVMVSMIVASELP
jgi:hypothetical protein